MPTANQTTGTPLTPHTSRPHHSHVCSAHNTLAKPLFYPRLPPLSCCAFFVDSVQGSNCRRSNIQNEMTSVQYTERRYFMERTRNVLRPPGHTKIRRAHPHIQPEVNCYVPVCHSKSGCADTRGLWGDRVRSSTAPPFFCKYFHFYVCVYYQQPGTYTHIYSACVWARYFEYSSNTPDCTFFVRA